MKIDTFTAISINGIVSGLSGGGSKIFQELSDNEILKFRDEIRNNYDAIMVGANTLFTDNPSLLNQNGTNRRVVIDKYNNLPLDLKIFSFKPETTILVSAHNKKNDGYFRKLEKKGVNITFVEDINNLNGITQSLQNRGIQSLLVEGGANLLGKFFSSRMIHSIQIVVFPFFTSKGHNIFSNQIIFTKATLVESFIISSRFVFLKYSF